MTDVTESGDDVENILNNILTPHHPPAGPLWWVSDGLGRCFLGGFTAHHVLARGTLTSIRYQEEVLRPIVRPNAGAVVLGSF